MTKFFTRNQKGFSLIEALIALTIFGIIATIGMNTFITTYKTTQRSNTENVLLEDARYIMARLSEEIRTQNLDYAEYFSNQVLDADKEEVDKIAGQNHQLYAWQFYNGGIHPGTQAEHGIGSLCQTAEGQYKPHPHPGCVTGSLRESEDNSTGQFPSSHRIPDASNEIIEITNAVCVTSDLNAGVYNFSAQATGNNNCTELNLEEHFLQRELFLINEDATKKTIIRSKKINIDNQEINVLALNSMERTDQATYEFTCMSEFPCQNLDSDPETLEPSRNDNERSLFEDFMPISPLRTNIKSIRFLITPLEDPKLAFAENFSSVRTQPSVTILLTVEPISRLKPLFGRQNLDLTLQTTVTTRAL